LGFCHLGEKDMRRYQFKARDREGRLHQGVMEADGISAVALALRGENFYPISIRKSLPQINLRMGKVSRQKVISFSLELSSMLDSGIPLLSSLETLAKESYDKGLKKILEQVISDVQGGASFSGALSKHPRAFPNLLINMVQAGEEGGMLAEVLQRYAGYAEREEDLKAKLKEAMIYPLLITILSMGVVVLLVTFVIPKFTEILAESNLQLPWTTSLLLAITNFIRGYYKAIGVIGFLAVIGLKRFTSTRRGKRILDRVKLRLPIFGGLFRKLAASRLSRVLSALLSGGIPLLKGIKVAKKVVGNQVITEELERVEDRLYEGGRMSDELRRSSLFPPLMVEMTTVGEESGNLDRMLDKVAGFYEKQIEKITKKLIAGLEPILLVVMAGVVGFIALSMLMAIMRAYQGLQ